MHEKKNLNDCSITQKHRETLVRVKLIYEWHGREILLRNRNIKKKQIEI